MRAAWAVLLCGVFGCAAQAPVPAVQAPPPAAPAPAPVRPVAPSRGNGTRAVLDSMPSPEAITILGSIPEPLSATQTIDPPARSQTPVPVVPVPAPPSPAAPTPSAPAPRDTGFSAPAVEAGNDTLNASLESVPVPSSTRPLGTPEPLPPVTSPSAPVAASGAEPDTCWRLQVAAPAERAKAVAMQSAAKSLLLVPMVIVRDAGRYKVRSEECLPRAAADALRDRAVASGFNGVFLVREVRKPR